MDPDQWRKVPGSDAPMRKLKFVVSLWTVVAILAPEVGYAAPPEMPRQGRVANPKPENYSPEQKAMAERIVTQVGGDAPRGPFALLLHTPNIADGALSLFSAFRFQNRLPQRLLELMILTVARQWSGQYEWFAHAPRALSAGLDPADIEAIRLGRVPKLDGADERLVYDLVGELTTRRALSQATYAKAKAALGEEPLIELISATGYYTMISIILVAFEVPPPAPSPEKPLP